MDTAAQAPWIRQHLIDPEICIRCNTCEATCPAGAVTHDDTNYVVRADLCNGCMDCIAPCPTGSIDNWRTVPRDAAYSVEAQLGWQALPPERTDGPAAPAAPAPPAPAAGATVPPWSAARPFTNLFTPQRPATATVVGNVNCTEAGWGSETHHVVLDFGSTAFPVLEGQSLGIIPPGTDAQGRPHQPRQYSIASPRNGERPGYNNLALTVKRVTTGPDGQALRGVASNHLCDLKVGDTVQVVGPFGTTFLMPNHPGSHVVMVCTGTGSAPMRAMTEWRRRLRQGGGFDGGRLLLFFGARTPQELPYFGPLQRLPRDFIDIHLAYSRVAGQPRRYVQDHLRAQAADLAALLRDGNSHFYVCGLRSMEGGVLAALRDIATGAGLDWEPLAATLRREGRLHLETY